MDGAGTVLELETERLRLRPLAADDAAFVLDLLNQPSFIRFIGDRGVRTIEDAHAYIADGPVTSYAHHGFGLLAVVPRHEVAPAGICGIMRKDWLPAPDLAYAFLPGHWSKGYAREAAGAVLRAASAAAIPRLCAVVTPANDASIRLLEKLGFSPDGTVTDPRSGEPLRRFARELQDPETPLP